MSVILSRIGLIVDNVVGYGTTENMSTMNIMATYIVGEIIGKNDFFTNEQNRYLALN